MKKETEKWIGKAEGDFQVATLFASLKPPSPVHTCYHCQQCAEKYLQAILVEWNAPGPRIHDLEKLHDLAISHDPSLAGIRKGLAFVTKFANEDGFPVDRGSARQARSALRWTTRVRAEVRKRLKLPI